MPQSLANNLIHLVFSTKHREPRLADAVRPALHAYLATVFKNLQCPVLTLNSVEDHIHILFALHRTVALSAAVEDAKKSSSKWSPAYVILRKRTELADLFYKHFLKSHHFIQQPNKKLEGLRDGKMISYKQFSGLLLSALAPTEQHRIADCLPPLDDLIAAEVRQLDALRKGSCSSFSSSPETMKNEDYNFVTFGQ